MEFNRTKDEMQTQRNLIERMNKKECRALGLKVFQNTIEAFAYRRKTITFKEI
jgi:hypothetical protein